MKMPKILAAVLFLAISTGWTVKWEPTPRARAADAPDARAKTHFTASPRERFVLELWLSGETTKTVAAQDEALRLWSLLKLRDVQAQARAIEKSRTAKGDRTPVDDIDFADDQAAYVVDRDEVDALEKAISPREDRPMPNGFSLVLGPFRQRLETALGKK